MSRPLKPFGEGSSGYDSGYTLPLMTGWLEEMANHEQDENIHTPGGRKTKRLNKVWDAIQLLNEAIEEGGES